MCYSQPWRAPMHRHNLCGNNRSYAHQLNVQMDSTEPGAKTYRTQLLQQAIRISYKMEQKREDQVYTMQFLQQAVEKVNERPGDLFEYVCYYMFNQKMSAKKVIEKHGKIAAIDAQLTGFVQLKGLNTLMGMHTHDLTKPSAGGTPGH